MAREKFLKEEAEMMDNIDLGDRNDFSESVLISQRVIPYLHNLGYKFLSTNLPITKRNRIIQADVVVYNDKEKIEPYIVVEVKRKLPNEVTLLDPAVQQAFTLAVELGPSVRYLLISDGQRYDWFERSAKGTSLVQLSNPPETEQRTEQLLLLSKSLVPITDPEQFIRLMQLAIQVLREEIPNGLKVGIELNRILIAKLYDEQVILEGQDSNFTSTNETAELVASKIEKLYKNAVTHLNDLPPKDGLWILSPRALLNVVKILEPYALSFVTPNIRGHFFWQTFPNFINFYKEGVFTTPALLAELLVELVEPHQGDRIIDPACGTGLFLIESLKHIEIQSLTGENPFSSIEDIAYKYQQNVVGVEWNPEVAELARTNLVLNGISPKQIVRANALDERELKSFGIEKGIYDIVLLDPPIGMPTRDDAILRQFEVTKQSGKITLEELFIERAIDLTRPGGMLAIFVPDSLLAGPTYLHFRRWLLNRTIPRAIISLPTETFAPSGHTRKATILLLRRRSTDVRLDDTVLVADVQSIGYDKFGQATNQSDLPDLIKAVRTFLDVGQIEVNKEGSKLKVWLVAINELIDTRLDVTQLNPAGQDILLALEGSQYRIVRLDQIVDIISGNNFKKYVEKGPKTAIVLQAGAVKDLVLDISSAPYISLEEYEEMKRVQVKIGDVLVTTSGQYLGRAVAIDDLTENGVASGAVTILRPLSGSGINPFFLAAVISSDLGKKQIAQRVLGIAQPYIRRTDIGKISIPLPSLRKQEEIAARIRGMLTESQMLVKRVHELESSAKQLVITELLAGDDNE